MYEFRRIRQTDDMFDFEILFNNEHIGELNINNNHDTIFIRHIGIDTPFRRCGHARNVVEHIFTVFSKDICFCVAASSDSAVKFWNRLLEEKAHTHIRGNIYRLNKII